MDAVTPEHLTQLQKVREIASRAGITIDAIAFERFLAYQALLLSANLRVNLTRITDPEDFEVRVLAESLLLLACIPAEAKHLLDVGSGGGVPGIVLAIARPKLHVTLLDATGKKVRFLAETAETLGLKHVTALQGRAEVLAHDPQHREHYDVVTARAVARLVTLVELTLPFAHSGGTVILPKGSAARDELVEARFAIGLLGGQARAIVDSLIVGTNLIVVDKLRRTPDEYPRWIGVPNSTPLTRSR